MEYEQMKSGTKITKVAVIGALCFAPVMSMAQTANPWMAPRIVSPAPVVPAKPKVMPKYKVETPVAPFQETLAAPATTPEPSRFAPADLGRQLAMASQQPAILPRAFGSISQGAQAPLMAPDALAQNSNYARPVLNGYAAPSPYGYGGAPNRYSNGYYPTQQPYGLYGIPWGGNNSWPSFGNLPFGGAPNFGFW